MEDREIVALYWARDERALEETQSKYGAFCRRLAGDILTLQEDAEECVNDTWHRAWDTIPPTRPDSLRAYLGRIVRTLSLDRWRRLHAQKRGMGLETLLSELEECVPGAPSAQQELEDREITRVLESWLRSLPAEDRALFLRRYWYGSRVDELAGAWGCRPNQMAQRLLRLRRQLKKALEREGVDL